MASKKLEINKYDKEIKLFYSTIVMILQACSLCHIPNIKTYLCKPTSLSIYPADLAYMLVLEEYTRIPKKSLSNVL